MRYDFQLSLKKEGHLHAHRYSPCFENEVRTAINEVARNPQSGLNKFDAVLLAYMINVKTEAELERRKYSQIYI